MKAPAARPDRTLVVILSVIAVLVIVALLAVFTRGEPERLDAATPEGVVQRYAAAVIAGDEPAAAEYLTANRREPCYPSGFASTDNIRITIVSTTVRADSADVRVSIVTFSDGGPFGGSEYESEDVFDLLKVDGRWLIETAPWPLTVCPATAEPTATVRP